MKLQVLVLCMIIGFVCSLGVEEKDAWDGVWTDSEYGGDLSICVDDDQFYGFYSGIGIMIGELDDDGSTVEGVWYEAGWPTGDCVRGTFTLSLSSGDGDEFEGTYTCNGDDEDYAWSERRTSHTHQTTTQCGRLIKVRDVDEGRELNGVWGNASGNDVENLCVYPEDHSWEMSYQYPDGEGRIIQGYAEGDLFEDGRVLQGWNKNQVSRGSILIFLNRLDELNVVFQNGRPGYAYAANYGGVNDNGGSFIEVRDYNYDDEDRIFCREFVDVEFEYTSLYDQLYTSFYEGVLDQDDNFNDYDDDQNTTEDDDSDNDDDVKDDDNDDDNDDSSVGTLTINFSLLAVVSLYIFSYFL